MAAGFVRIECIQGISNIAYAFTKRLATARIQIIWRLDLLKLHHKSRRPSKYGHVTVGWRIFANGIAHLEHPINL